MNDSEDKVCSKSTKAHITYLYFWSNKDWNGLDILI